MNIAEKCEKYLTVLNEINKDLANRYVSRRISFFNREIPENFYSLGYVETIVQQDGALFLTDEDLNDEKYETLEMQLKQVPKRNQSILRKHKYVPSSLQIKLHSKARSKSIIEPRKFFQPYKIIGSEGEDNGEFKHPLGKRLFLNF